MIFFLFVVVFYMTGCIVSMGITWAITSLFDHGRLERLAVCAAGS